MVKILPIQEHTLWMAQLCVEHQFVDKHKSGEFVYVKKTFKVRIIIDGSCKAVEIALSLFKRQHGLALREIRVFDVYRQRKL